MSSGSHSGQEQNVWSPMALFSGTRYASRCSIICGGHSACGFESICSRMLHKASHGAASWNFFETGDKILAAPLSCSIERVTWSSNKARSAFVHPILAYTSRELLAFESTLTTRSQNPSRSISQTRLSLHDSSVAMTPRIGQWRLQARPCRSRAPGDSYALRRARASAECSSGSVNRSEAEHGICLKRG